MNVYLVSQGTGREVTNQYNIGIFESKKGADLFVEMHRAGHEGIWSLETTKKYDIWFRPLDGFSIKIERFKVHP